MSDNTRTLYRPVGLEEARLILAADAIAFPPRLPHQPIFYPVLNIQYARQIARDWNTKDAASGYAGFITEFDVDSPYLSRFDQQQVGANTHQELWIPAGQLAAFNDHIDGHIRFVEAYYGADYQGLRHHQNDWYAGEILKRLYLADRCVPVLDLRAEVSANRDALLLNFPYWRIEESIPDMPADQKQAFLNKLVEYWLSENAHLEAAAHGLLQVGHTSK